MTAKRTQLFAAGAIASALLASMLGAQSQPGGQQQPAAATLGPVPAPVGPTAGAPGPYPADANPPTVSPRPANAPKLVPVDVNKDGNYRIAPSYKDDPAFTEKAGVPKGRLVSFVMDSADSKIYPVGLDREGLLQRFGRLVTVYIPPGYVAGAETPFIIAFDGPRKYVKSDLSVPDVVSIPTMLDNLIAEKRVPSMVAVLIMPGRPNQHRSIEYDTVSDTNAKFIETEVLPRIAKDYNINFTKNPAGRAAIGESSGSAAAMGLAWFHPELYSRVISYSGTFTALRNDVFAPHGAWEYHENLIPKSPRKPLRIWLQVSEFDNGYDTPEANRRNWVIANNKMADALKAKGYPYQYVFTEGVGHVNRPMQRQTMAQAFEWTWKGYKPK